LKPLRQWLLMLFMHPAYSPPDLASSRLLRVIYRRRSYTVEARLMANGNWLVVDENGDRSTWSAADFEMSFELVDTQPAYTCSTCHRELVYDTVAEALVCRVGCRG
jgi:hypothetical protein